MCRKCGFSKECKVYGSSSSIVYFLKSIIFGSLLFALPSDSLIKPDVCIKKSFYRKQYFNAVSVTPGHQFADLTPAVDKFAKFPSKELLQTSYSLTAKGPSPPGPDPFTLVADELQPLSDYVRELVVSENPVLTMAASHFFDKVSK